METTTFKTRQYLDGLAETADAEIVVFKRRSVSHGPRFLDVDENVMTALPECRIGRVSKSGCIAWARTDHVSVEEGKEILRLGYETFHGYVAARLGCVYTPHMFMSSRGASTIFTVKPLDSELYHYCFKRYEVFRTVVLSRGKKGGITVSSVEENIRGCKLIDARYTTIRDPQYYEFSHLHGPSIFKHCRDGVLRWLLFNQKADRQYRLTLYTFAKDPTRLSECERYEAVIPGALSDTTLFEDFDVSPSGKRLAIAYKAVTGKHVRSHQTPKDFKQESRDGCLRIYEMPSPTHVNLVAEYTLPATNVMYTGDGTRLCMLTNSRAAQSLTVIDTE